MRRSPAFRTFTTSPAVETMKLIDALAARGMHMSRTFR